MTELTEQDATRFWEKVDKSAGPDACWLWLAGRFKAGYGCFYGTSTRSLYAHRIAFQLSNGAEPRFNVCHTCDNPPCCNPRHLFDAPQAVNIADMNQKGRNNSAPARNAVKTHCKHGHEFTEANTRVFSRPGRKPERQCIACNTIRSRAQRSSAWLIESIGRTCHELSELHGAPR